MNDNLVQLTDATFDSLVLHNQSLPILVDFWAEWCGPCKALSPILEALADEYQGRVIVAKLNIDENPVTAPKYHIRSIPTLLLFKQGAVVATQVGGLSTKELGDFLKKHL
ncbi:thioredoxin TrxA [unidentified bacterial endosymbiont]|uniref:thioredoxin TrxA n=1 Tax=unidentified bacterial endosymbiont TaxID=2355 RepID=UPI0020A12FE1|nr:thioredoxin TrxA [unidentified bacterial endosymbiont]